MVKTLRVAIVAMLALVAGMAASNASAQMMHYTLNVVVETEDGSAIPAGQVCVSGEVDPICQDIPDGTPSGREFAFPDLALGQHDVTVNADPYLEAVDTVDFSEDQQVVTLTLQMEVTPGETPTAVPALPDTGAGITASHDGGSISFLLVTGLLGAAGALAVASATFRRKVR
ncbi:MAG: hypothetical protein ACTHQE_03855 [Thermomicrobiales bacterium]